MLILPFRGCVDYRRREISVKNLAHIIQARTEEILDYA